MVDNGLLDMVEYFSTKEYIIDWRITMNLIERLYENHNIDGCDIDTFVYFNDLDDINNNEEEFSKLRPNINIPSLGKFHIEWERLKNKKEDERLKNKKA